MSRKELRKGNKTKNRMMTNKGRFRNSLGKDVCRHICSRYPRSREQSIRNVCTKEMIMNINML